MELNEERSAWSDPCMYVQGSLIHWTPESMEQAEEAARRQGNHTGISVLRVGGNALAAYAHSPQSIVLLNEPGTDAPSLARRPTRWFPRFSRYVRYW